MNTGREYGERTKPKNAVVAATCFDHVVTAATVYSEVTGARGGGRKEKVRRAGFGLLE